MKLNKILRQNNFWLSLMTVMAISLLIPIFGVYAGLAEYVGKFIFYVLFFPFIALFELEMIILPIIAQFNNFTKLPGIVAGWTALRDLSNMFFIVVLLVMAFATILKISSYGYKELLKTLIIMAILINFSKTITGLLIDVGQVVMLTFVAAIKDVAAGNLTAMFGVDQMVTLGKKSTGEEISADSSQIVLAYLLGGVMMMLASIVLMAFIVTLVMRIIFLWVLVVLSPLAFLANTFPSTKKYFSEWFSSLSKEIIVGPVLIFFLWLSLTIMSGNSSSSGNKSVKDELTKNQSVGSQQDEADKSLTADKNVDVGLTEAGKWDNVMMFIVSLSILIASLKITQKIGSAAGGVGLKAADKMKAGMNYVDKKVGFQKGRDLAWKGSTGEGGLKLGMQRAGTKIAAPVLTKVGRALSPVGGGVLIRAGALMKGRKDQAVQRKQKKLEEKYGVVRDEEKGEVLKSRGGKYSQRMLDKFNIEEGNVKGMSEDDVKDMKKRAKDVNDKETVKKLEAGSAHAHDKESIEGMMAGKNLAAASGISAESLAVTGKDGKPNKGAIAVADHIFANYDADQVKKWTENMTKKEQAAWREAMSAAAQRATGGEKFDFGTMFKKDEDGKRIKDDKGNLDIELDKDSHAYKAAMLDDKVYAQAYDGLTDEAGKKQLAKAKGEATRAEDLPKKKQSDMGDDAYRAMVGNLSAQKASTFISNLSPDDSRVEIVASEQVAKRDSGFLDSAALSGVLDAQKRERIAQAGFDKKIKVQVEIEKAKGSGKDEQVVRVEMAKENLRQAHNFFATPQELTAFVNTLKAREASQVDRGKLEDILGDISVELREELAETYGIGKKQKESSGGKSDNKPEILDSFGRPIRK